MKFFKLKPLAIALVAVVILAGCKGDQGDPGPSGANGATGAAGAKGDTGATGADGTNGVNGTNGLGFDEAVAKGSIVVYLDGKRPDGIAFKDTLNFRFSSPDVNSNSRIIRYMAPSDSNNYAYIERNLGYLNNDDSYQGTSGIYSQLYATSEGDTLRYIDFWLETPIVFESEHTYFDLSDEFYFNEWEEDANVSDSTLTNYSYSSTTGSLKYKTSFVSDDNNTDYTLKVTVVVDASVYQYVSSSAPTRTIHHHSANGRTANVKAVMKPMK